jgi:superfamily II DNA or RNA helicase
MIYLQKGINSPKSEANLEKVAKSKLMNRLESYQTIISQKNGIKEIPYQKDFIVNNEEFPKPFVLAGGTSSGKTITTAIWIEMFYQNPLNKGKRTLLIPASTTVLRDNMGDTFDIFNPNFDYCVCKDKEDLLSAINRDCDVIICLPQTLVGSISELKHFHNFILDEAHQWYFMKTITAIIMSIQPINQLLLTGTPSKFIARGNKKFDFYFVSVMDLYELGFVCNVGIKVVSSTYNPSQSDYSSTYGSLGDSYKLKESDNTKSLKMVCKEMIAKLGSNRIKLSSSNPYSVLGDIEKTIIYCHSQKQANQFHKILNKTKGLVGNVLVSHTEVDRNSVLFSQFKSDDSKKVLIAVNRGKLGFSMGELFNVIDFTLTQNIDMLLQMYGRVLRLSKHNPTKPKTYYKVATKDTAEYFVNLMKGMLCLTDMEWYSTYNGKNMGGMIIQNVINNKVASTTSTKRTKSKSVKPYVSIEELGIPLDLSFFKNIGTLKDTHKFTTIAECSLDEVRREFFGIRKVYTIEEAKEAIAKCSTLKQLRMEYKWVYQWCNLNGQTNLFKSLEYGKNSHSIESVKEAIAQSSTLKEFRAKYLPSYQWCQKNKRMDLYEHLKSNKIIKSITFEEVKEAISKCSTLRELSDKYKSALQWVYRNNRVDLIQDLYTKRIITEEEVKEAILKCSTLKEFNEKYERLNKWCIKRKRQDLTKHLPKGYPNRIFLTEVQVVEAINKCSTLKEFINEYKQYYSWCMNHKKTDLYKHLDSITKPRTIEQVKEDIAKCSTLKQLRKEYMSTYNWVLSHNQIHLIKHLGRYVHSDC